jgi:hypothetical protein
MALEINFQRHFLFIPILNYKRPKNPDNYSSSKLAHERKLDAKVKSISWCSAVLFEIITINESACSCAPRLQPLFCLRSLLH